MRRLTFTTILLLLATTLLAQPPRMGEGGERGARGGGMHTMQCEQIINILQLEEAKQQPFRETFNAYNDAVKALRPAPEQHKQRGEGEKASEEEIEASILRSFETSIKSMEIKQEYYSKFREILTPSQISKMYRIERNIRDRAIEELQQRGRNGGAGGKGGGNGGVGNGNFGGGNRPTPPIF